MILYFIVFGDTTAQLVGSFFDKSLGDAWYASKMVYVLILAGALSPVILKKELAELEFLSYLLFGSIGLFIVVNFIQLEFDSNFEPATVTKQFFRPSGGIALIESLNVTLVAYNYQQNLYPIYSSLKVKNNRSYMKTASLGLFLTMVIYLIVALISMYMFGETLETNVLINIGDARKADGGLFWEAYVTQIAFMLLLLCHIPFVFFAGKEGLLIIIDELDRKSISNALWHKINASAPHFAQGQVGELPPNPTLPIPGDVERRPYSELIKMDED